MATQVYYQKSSFLTYLKNLPKSQLTWPKQRSKLTILVLLILLFVVPAIICWTIVYTRNQSPVGVWYATEKWSCWLFTIVTPRNEIIEYPIWSWFSSVTPSWLLILQILLPIFGLGLLALVWFFIDNKVLFGFVLLLYLGIMFNSIDSVADGFAVDYFAFNKSFKWLEIILIWPCYIVSPPTPDPTAFNLPDLAISIGVQGTLVFIVVWSIKKIIKHNKNKNEKRG